jgi:hypothetical protein
MKAIYFIETKEGRRLYKTDTFWSKSDKIEHAKIHNDSLEDQKRFLVALDSLRYNKDITNDDFKFFEDRYVGGKYGYQVLLETENNSEIMWNPKPDTKLSDPIYLTEILSLDRDGKMNYIEIEAYKRDKQIEKILN